MELIFLEAKYILRVSHNRHLTCTFDCGRAMRIPRRIDDRIRQLCAVAATDDDSEPFLQELLQLVHVKSERLRTRAARLLLNSEHLEPERRSTDAEES